jgi:hypothetical protein
LGGLANPSSTAQELSKPVPVAVKKAVEKTEISRKPVVKAASSFANLASLVGGNIPNLNRDRSTVNQARSVSTKLGDMAKNPAAHREVKQPATKEKDAVQSKESTPAAKSNADSREAFQRALLSSQIANGKATVATDDKMTAPTTKDSAAPAPKGFSSLSGIIQGRDKRSITPTVNKDRSKSSLFPEPSEYVRCVVNVTLYVVLCDITVISFYVCQVDQHYLGYSKNEVKLHL